MSASHSTFERLPPEILHLIAEDTDSHDDNALTRHGSTLALIKTSRRCHDIGAPILYRTIAIDACKACRSRILETLVHNRHYASLVRRVAFRHCDFWGMPGGSDERNVMLVLHGLLRDALANLTHLQSISSLCGTAESLLVPMAFPHLRSLALGEFTRDTQLFLAKHAPQLRILAISSAPGFPSSLDLADLRIFKGPAPCLLAAVVCPAAPRLTHLQLKQHANEAPASSVFASLGITMPTLRLLEIWSWGTSWDMPLMESIARVAPNLVSLMLSVEAYWAGSGMAETRDRFIATINSALPRLPQLFHLEFSQPLYASYNDAEDAQAQQYIEQLDCEAAWVRQWGSASPVLGVCTLPATRWWRLSHELWAPVVITKGYQDLMDHEGLGDLSTWTRRRTAAQAEGGRGRGLASTGGDPGRCIAICAPAGGVRSA
ncbi:hypothetical protein MIND_00903600 [Mycena indigotica]|uniref:F-box domain-containing protein n=1 Tax=Mycena indigotica TaxID=2126181 RepID=A0A8H6SJN4_9AGAR|nr:uncharacterized protein MIND_00903600 [Mycena indigotica]KAF7299532.1 hypothetical protein MIND_00903600 [Mycena indigotica]